MESQDVQCPQARVASKRLVAKKISTREIEAVHGTRDVSLEMRVLL
ncbi:MAG: hypothetical protein M3122_09355 [Actinomycetota bacterium]|nr:hypothetical protein [Actinomycetota bacterium]